MKPFGVTTGRNKQLPISGRNLERTAYYWNIVFSEKNIFR